MNPAAFIIVAVIAALVGAASVYVWLIVDAWLFMLRDRK